MPVRVRPRVLNEMLFSPDLSEYSMAHVVTEACIRCRYTDCVEVCPTEAFHVGDKMLVIGPSCIDCGLCVMECAPGAIYAEEDLPEDQKVFKELNRYWAAKWPVIKRKEIPLPNADEWKEKSFKRDQIPELLTLPDKNHEAS
jgi:ferredoxin